MIYAKIALLAFILLAAIYYAMEIAQLFDIVHFTDKELTFPKLLIPFYYWL